MTTATLRNARDTYVAEDRPNARLHNKATLWLAAPGASNTRFAYVYFSRPFPIGATVLSATLKLYNTHNWPGDNTISIRRINERWSVSRARWGHAPDVWGVLQSVTKNNGTPDGTEWAIDIQPLMQAVADGARWYGLRIEVDTTAARALYSSRSRWRYRPVLEVEWADRPDAPEEVYPSSGRAVSISHPTLRFDFTDVSGDTDLQSVHVQTAATEDALLAGTPAWDSGTVAASEPELDLDTWSSSRTVAVNTTSASAGITAAAGTFSTTMDPGATISGVGIPAGATIASVQSDTAATMSVAATATGSSQATITRLFPGVDVDEEVWWRVRVQDGAGLWSGWSEPENFTRKLWGVITINNPAEAPNNFVEEPTPPIIWSYSGVQRAWQLFIYDIEERRWIWNSGKITGDDLQETVPSRILRENNKQYRLRVRIWDNQERESTPGDPAFLQLDRDFTFNLDPTTDPVTNFTGMLHPMYPWVTLNWQRVTAPDSFTVTRDGRVIEDNIEPSEVLVEGTSDTYTFTDKFGHPREEHTWRVHAVVNGRSSGNNPTVVLEPRAITTTISRPDGSDAVLIFNPDNDIEQYEASEAHGILGDAPPVWIGQSLGGYQGTIGGRLAPHGGISAQTWRNRLEEIRDDTGREMQLTIKDLSFRAIVYNIKWWPVSFPDHVEYDMSAEFYQADEW